MTYLSINLKILREQHNLTQEQVAQKIYVSRPLYTFFETGRHRPRLDHAQRLAELFTVDIHTLLNVPLEKKQ
jgi:transcriptional regulator with XRE-family HTH domain